MNWDLSRLRDLVVFPPLEAKDTVLPYVRGNIRVKTQDSILRDFVVTGPRMRVAYSGCSWNRIVFGLPETDGELIAFRKWLRDLSDNLRAWIWSEPQRFKRGSVSSARFVFDDPVKASNNPAFYPDELKCRLSTIRGESEDDETVNTILVTTQGVHVKSSDIRSGDHVVPVLKFQYFRTGETFGLVVTVLKGIVYPYDGPKRRIENDEWDVDYPTDPSL